MDHGDYVITQEHTSSDAMTKRTTTSLLAGVFKARIARRLACRFGCWKLIIPSRSKESADRAMSGLSKAGEHQARPAAILSVVIPSLIEETKLYIYMLT